MKKSSVPLLAQLQKQNADAVIPALAQGQSQEKLPLTLSDLGVTQGPLGNRRSKPEIREMLAELYKKAGSGEAASSAVLSDESVAAPKQVIESMPQPSIPRLPVPPTPEVLGQPTLPGSLQSGEADLGTKGDVDPLLIRKAQTPTDTIAVSGAEARVKGLQIDTGVMNTILWKSSADRRVIFEKKRCKPIDWSSLFSSYDIRQDVLVWTKPEEIWATFRTMTSDDEHLARRVISEEFSKTDADYEVGSIVTTVAGGLVRIKDLVLPPIPQPGISKEVDHQARLEIMKTRVAMVLRLPYPLTTDLAINYSWFVLRVQEAQRAGELGNG